MKQAIGRYFGVTIILLVVIPVYVNTTPKQLHIVFRHGERAPTETYKNDPYINTTWSGGWGHLTNRGKLQMFTLGEKLRKIYGDFISEYYYPEDVRVLSSYSDRCLMSAEALLAGLFPPKGKQIWNEDLPWQPIPVHYVPRNQDNLIAMKAKCKRYDDEFARVPQSEEMMKIEEENRELFDYLGKATGQEMNTIGKVELLYNTLEIELLHNFTLPLWVQNVSLDHLKELAARSLQSFTETDFMKRMKGGVFLKHAIQFMEKTTNGEKVPYLHLYGAHDLTIVNILNTLGYKKMLKPGFGASFIIELNNASEISMMYRDDVYSKPEKIVLEKCKSSCTLQNYKAALALYIPNNWDAECNE